jgi:beta-galactosidase beta subunit
MKFIFTKQKQRSLQYSEEFQDTITVIEQTSRNLTAGFSQINFNNILSSKLWKYNVRPLQMAAYQVISSL